MILERVKKYKGSLGTFEYNTRDFELMVKYTATGRFDILHYRGGETDGSKIVIPKGITNCSYMFEKQSLVTPPVIPLGVVNTSYMFKDCKSLVRAAVLPFGVVKTSFMYQGCRSLTEVFPLPDSVKEAGYMFDKCVRLTTPPALSASLVHCSGMFRGYALEEQMIMVENT